MTRNRKRGFSITEVIIAMAVIGVVSFSAVSVLTQSNSTINNSQLSIYATNDTYNLLECFKISEDLEQFDRAAAFAGYSLEEDDGNLLVKNLYYVYEIHLIVDFERGTFYSYSYNTETGKQLCSVTFRKG